MTKSLFTSMLSHKNVPSVTVTGIVIEREFSTPRRLRVLRWPHSVLDIISGCQLLIEVVVLEYQQLR